MLRMLDLIPQRHMLVGRANDIPQALREVLAHLGHDVHAVFLRGDADQIQHVMNKMRRDLRLQRRVPRHDLLVKGQLLPFDGRLQPFEQLVEGLVE